MDREEENYINDHPGRIVKFVLAVAAVCLIAVIVRGLSGPRSVTRIDPRVEQRVNELMDGVREEYTRGMLVYVHLELQNIGRKVVPVLIKTLRTDDDERIRTLSANALARMDDKQAVAPLRASMQDVSPAVRSASIMALACLEDQSCLPDVRSALKDESGRVRAHAALALSFLGDETAIPALIESLSDESCHVQLVAITALRDMEAKAAIPSLIELLENKDDPRIRGNAHSALRMMTDQVFMKDRGKWEQWWKENKVACLAD